MRHLKAGRHLNRTASHRNAMLSNMVNSLFEHGRIITTPAKAKEARRLAEKMITLAKEDTIVARRRAIAALHNKNSVKTLFTEIAPRFVKRPGGYTRILRLSRTRIGDSAPQCIFELVDYKVEQGAAEQAPAAEAPVAEEAK